MSCNSPILVTKKKNNFEVPCGYCAGCRVDRTFEWSERIKHEIQYHDFKGYGNAFVALTYSDEFLPVRGCDKHEVQKFLKRLRARLTRHNVHFAGKDFKYFLVAEYGDQSGRPHYHAIFMGLDFAIGEKYVRATWPYGFIESDPILNGGVRYVFKS